MFTREEPRTKKFLSRREWGGSGWANFGAKYGRRTEFPAKSGIKWKFRRTVGGFVVRDSVRLGFFLVSLIKFAYSCRTKFY